MHILIIFFFFNASWLFFIVIKTCFSVNALFAFLFISPHDFAFCVLGKPKDWNEPHEGIFSDCGGKNCLHIENDNLCTRLKSDHNYNAICRNLLSHYAVEDRMPQGFLHDMPIEAEDYWDLGEIDCCVSTVYVKYVLPKQHSVRACFLLY